MLQASVVQMERQIAGMRFDAETRLHELEQRATSAAQSEAVALARELLGANGMLTDWIVAKHFCDAEAFYSYEGTYDINQLVAGRELLKLNGHCCFEGRG